MGRCGGKIPYRALLTGGILMNVYQRCILLEIIRRTAANYPRCTCETSMANSTRFSMVCAIVGVAHNSRSRIKPRVLDAFGP